MTDTLTLQSADLDDLAEFPPSGSAWPVVQEMDFLDVPPPPASVFVRSEEPSRLLRDHQCPERLKYIWKIPCRGTRSGGLAPYVQAIHLAIKTPTYGYLEETQALESEIVDMMQALRGDEDDDIADFIVPKMPREVQFSHTVEIKMSEVKRWRPYINPSAYLLDDGE
jgi:hypothetical protein